MTHSRSTDKPRLECCAGQDGTIIHDHSQGVAINPDQLSFNQKPLYWKEHRLHTGNSSSYESILENGLWAGRLSLRITRQACFFLNAQESSSRQRTIDWQGPDDERRMVYYKHSNRPDNDCMYYFNLRRAQNANLVFHQRCSDAINLVRQAHGTKLSPLQVTFCSKRNLPTSIKPETTLGKRIDLRISGQLEVPHTQDEKAEKHLLFPA